MTLSKVTITTLAIFGLVQTVVAAPNTIQSNATPDILVGGLAIETGNHTGPILNGSSTVYAKNAQSYQSGLCVFKINFSVYNDSDVNPGQFITTMGYNNQPSVINSYTILNSAGIKTYQSLVQLSPGNNTISVHADQQNTVQETNELNNRLTKRVKVIGECGSKNALASRKQAQTNTSLRAIKTSPKNGNLQANTTTEDAVLGCSYDPNSARLPCSRKPKMKLINPFE